MNELAYCELCLCASSECRWIAPLNLARYKIKHMLHCVEARAFFVLKERVLNEFLLETSVKTWTRGSWNKQKGVGIFNHFCIRVSMLTLSLSCQILWIWSLPLDGGELHIKINVQAQLNSRLQIPGGCHQQPRSKAKDNCIMRRLEQGWWCGKLL